MFDIKNHIKASSVDQAIDLLIQDPKARLIAGGTDVLIKLRDGQADFSSLVDIHGLEELRFICFDDQKNIRIGSGTVFTDLVQSDIIRDHVPILAEAADSIGGPQIRNVATIGGNICNGVTSADSAPSLFVLDARLEIRGKDGTRKVPIADFYLGPGKVDLRQGDVLVAFNISLENYKGFTGHFYKYAMRQAMDIATIGCAVSLKTTGNVLDDFRIAYGVAGPVPLRCPAAEQVASGQMVSGKLLEDIAATVTTDVTPRTSWRATKEFRLNIIQELARRVTRKALARAGKEI